MPEFVPSLFLHTFPSGRQCLATSAQSIAECVGMRHGEILRMARNIYTPRQSDGAFLASNVDFVPGSGTRIRGVSFSEIGCGNFLRLAGGRSRKMKAAFEKADGIFTAAFRAAARDIASASAVGIAGKVEPKAEPEPELKAQRLPIDEPADQPEQKQEEQAPAPAETEPKEEARPADEDGEKAAASVCDRCGRRESCGLSGDEKDEAQAVDSRIAERLSERAWSLGEPRERHVYSRVREVQELSWILEYRGYEPKQAVAIALENVYGWPTRPIGGSRVYRP